MINTVYGDLLSLKKGIIVHGCNAQGVMGSGIAKSIKDKWPLVFVDYLKAYSHFPALILGSIVPSIAVWRDVTKGEEKSGSRQGSPGSYSEVIVINAITQDFYGRNEKRFVDYDAIRSVFIQTRLFRNQLAAAGNELDINFPLIGAGLGGGDWAVIEPIINEALGDVGGTLWRLPETKPNNV